MFRNNDFLLKKQEFNADYASLHPSKQSGSVIIWIFVFIVIFAALSYVMSQGMRSGTTQLTQDQARLGAQEILDYGRALKQAVQQLQINGCTDEQISFENSTVAGYANANAPSDKSCNVFDFSNGGMKWIESLKKYNDGSDMFFYGKTCISDVGNGTAVDNVTTDCDATNNELLFIIPNLNLNVCLALNKNLGIADVNNEPPQDHADAWDLAPVIFTGTYTTGFQITDQSGSNSFDGKFSGCFEGGGTPAADTYHFYQVLIAR